VDVQALGLEALNPDRTGAPRQDFVNRGGIQIVLGREVFDALASQVAAGAVLDESVFVRIEGPLRSLLVEHAAERQIAADRDILPRSCDAVLHALLGLIRRLKLADLGAHAEKQAGGRIVEVELLSADKETDLMLAENFKTGFRPGIVAAPAVGMVDENGVKLALCRVREQAVQLAALPSVGAMLLPAVPEGDAALKRGGILRRLGSLRVEGLAFLLLRDRGDSDEGGEAKR